MAGRASGFLSVLISAGWLSGCAKAEEMTLVCWGGGSNLAELITTKGDGTAELRAYLPRTLLRVGKVERIDRTYEITFRNPVGGDPDAVTFSIDRFTLFGIRRPSSTGTSASARVICKPSSLREYERRKDQGIG